VNKKSQFDGEDRYRLLLESITDVIYALNRERRVCMANDAAASFFRLPKQGLLGSKLDDVLPQTPSRTGLLETLNGVMETGIPGVATADFVSLNGETKRHQIKVYPAPEGLLCISIDVSELKRQESALHDNGEKYRALIENSSDIIQIIDSEGIIRYLSPSVEGMLGYKPEELIGRRSIDIVHPDDLEAVARGFEEAFRNPGVPVVTECVASAGRDRHQLPQSSQHQRLSVQLARHHRTPPGRGSFEGIRGTLQKYH
jgi:PAS domain S-box-containing protein